MNKKKLRQNFLSFSILKSVNLHKKKYTNPVTKRPNKAICKNSVDNSNRPFNTNQIKYKIINTYTHLLNKYAVFYNDILRSKREEYSSPFNRFKV